MRLSRTETRLAIALVFVAFGWSARRASADYAFTTIDVANANTINVRTINNNGEAAGFYLDKTTSVRHSFLVAPSGQVTLFDVDGATGTFGTDIRSLNDSGMAAGAFNSTTGHQGFIRDSLGVVSTFSVNGAPTTEVNGINATGSTAGDFIDSSNVTHGFLRDPQGNITVIDPTGSVSTVVRGISDTGFVVGDFGNGHGNHGFIRDVAGTITIFDPAGSTDTIVESVNRYGVAAGYYFANNVQHGFVRDALGNITTFNIPGATSTGVNWINDSGVVAGSYSSGGPQGYLRNPDGSYDLTVLPPNSLAGIVSSVNNSGQISGYYNDNVTGAFHGFIGTPTAVPEPTSLSLLILGAVAVLGYARKLRTSV